MSIPKNERSGFYHYEPGAAKILGRFQIINTPVMGPWLGHGFTPTRVGVGDYLITLTDAFTQIVAVTATVLNAANNVDMYAQIGALVVGATPTVQILTKTVGAVTEVPDDDWVSFEITLRSEWT